MLFPSKILFLSRNSFINFLKSRDFLNQRMITNSFSNKLNQFQVDILFIFWNVCKNNYSPIVRILFNTEQALVFVFQFSDILKASKRYEEFSPVCLNTLTIPLVFTEICKYFNWWRRHLIIFTLQKLVTLRIGLTQFQRAVAKFRANFFLLPFSSTLHHPVAQKKIAKTRIRPILEYRSSDPLSPCIKLHAQQWYISASSFICLINANAWKKSEGSLPTVS